MNFSKTKTIRIMVCFMIFVLASAIAVTAGVLTMTPRFKEECRFGGGGWGMGRDDGIE